jgi:nucleotide-binding universal stress UspA family protein
MHIAKGLGLPVDLVRVIPTLQEYAQLAVAPGMYNPSLERLSEEVAQEASQYLGRIQERLQQEGAESVEVHLFRGHAAECIIDMASEIPDTLVAMTTHGRSGVGRWVLGSVADRVVRHSGAPVLVVHGTEAEGG